MLHIKNMTCYRDNQKKKKIHSKMFFIHFLRDAPLLN